MVSFLFLGFNFDSDFLVTENYGCGLEREKEKIILFFGVIIVIIDILRETHAGCDVNWLLAPRHMEENVGA